jgi:hypothetical protein
MARVVNSELADGGMVFVGGLPASGQTFSIGGGGGGDEIL